MFCRITNDLIVIKFNRRFLAMFLCPALEMSINNNNINNIYTNLNSIKKVIIFRSCYKKKGFDGSLISRMSQISLFKKLSKTLQKFKKLLLY
jgi:hypothetical protein